MTRKDYIRIADLAAKARPADPCRAVDWEYYIKDTIIPWLQEDNPRFDPERFLDACGVEKDGVTRS